ncbi:peroxidase-related enzyme [Mycobacterium sp. THU-M104]|uniref:peroxidase-related enzyme n=1 Tax=Mycobacterium sp. THU-M104 TaxID=3410515 RepID=UPI003B9DA51C
MIDADQALTKARQISRYPVVDPHDLSGLPDDLRVRIQEIGARSGFVPNVFLAMAHRPDEARAFFAYHDAVMERSGGLSKADRELIVVATSAANRCPYCVVAHGAIARVRTKNPHIADQVATHWPSAELTDRQRAMLDAAVKLAVQPWDFGESDRESLRGHGFSDEDIWDIAAVTALFGLSNRMAHVMALRPNDEFYLLGRIPRAGRERSGDPAASTREAAEA